MEWKDHIHKRVKQFYGEIPPIVLDAIDAAYLAGMRDQGVCSKCQAPFEKHHHRHIVKDRIFHTKCYKKDIVHGPINR